MRTPEERIHLIQRRTAELKKAKQRQKQWIIAASGVASCLCLIISLSFCMPKWMTFFSESTVHRVSGVASMFGNHAWVGYIIVSVLSFLLGMTLTILLYRLNQRQKSKQQEELTRH